MSLEANNRPDVIVIGAGLIGCSVALQLAQAKLRVTVVERGEPGCEASSAGAGMIAPQGETTEPDDFYKLCAASRDLYPNFVSEIAEISGMESGFSKEATIFAALDDAQADDLDRVYRAQRAAGLPVAFLTSTEARRRCPQLNSSVRSSLWMEGDHRVDNEMLIVALVEACRRSGVTFARHTAITRLCGNGNRVVSAEARNGSELSGGARRSGAAERRYSAGLFVITAGAWSGELAASLGMSIPLSPCRGQLLELDGAQDFSLTMRAGHHYLVPRSGGRLVAGSIMEYVGFEKSVTAAGLQSILAAAERIAPRVGALRFRRAWAGFRPDTADHLPIFGRAKYDNLVFATGHFRNGILLTPITAKLISELILSGSPSMPIEAYSPARFGKAAIPAEHSSGATL